MRVLGGPTALSVRCELVRVLGGPTTLSVRCVLVQGLMRCAGCVVYRGEIRLVLCMECVCVCVCVSVCVCGV